MSLLQHIKWLIAQRAELIWWKRYLKNKNTHSYLNWKQAYWRQFQEQYAIQLKGNILEIGNGPAGFFVVNEKSGTSYTAIDPLNTSYQSTLEIFNPKHYPQVEFKNCTWENFKLNKSYDTILAFNAINHFKSLEDSIEKLAAAAQPSADIYISIDLHRFSLLKLIFNLLPGDILHPQQFGKTAFEKLILKAGLKIKCVKVHRQESIFNYTVYHITK